jgi:hypothetical protein
MQARSDAVEAGQDLAFRQARGKFPVPILPDLFWIKPAAGITDGTALGIMEPDGDAPLEESRALVGPGLKAPGRMDIDSLACVRAGARED